MGKSFEYIKILGLTIIVVLIPLKSTVAQSCLEEGIRFSRQNQIDQFSNTYPGCQTVLGSLTIEEDNPGNIRDLTGLAQIQTIHGALIIQNNDSLKRFSGLDDLHFLGDHLFIIGNSALINFEGWNNLSVIEGSVNISDNASLNQLSGLETLEAVPGDLTISNNPKLTDLKGLDQVSFIGHHFIVNGNRELRNFTGLSNMALIGKELLVIDNPELGSFSGLESLHNIGTHLVIDHNNLLQNLNGLNNLIELGGNIQIVNNERITNLKGLSHVQSMDGLLQVYNNPVLESLSGIDSIDASSIDELVLFSSINLSSCSVKSVCDYLKQSENLTTVRENGPGCQDIDEILEKCPRDGPDIVSYPTADTYFFPNPNTGVVHIRDPVPDHARFRATDIIGRKMLEGDVIRNKMDLDFLAAGMYLIEVWFEEEHFKEFVILIE